MVAALLQEYADPITITGGEEYKVRSYERAARAVAGYHADASALDLKGLKEIPNVGGAIAEKVLEFFHSGQMAAVEQLRGFGPRTAENIAHGIELLRRGGGRVLISDAMAVAEEVVAGLAALPECVDAAYAGSLRRMRDTIGDVDVLAAARDSAPLMAEFARMPQVAEVIAHGSTKSSIRTEEGLQVDLRVVTPEVWGAAMLYFTGSREHNVRVREIAVRHGLKLSEYGLFRAEDDELIVAETEQEVYERLGLPWIPPPLREDRGELDAAQSGSLPRLLSEEDIRGDLHTHTDLTDGVSSLAEMVAAARSRGYRYYAVTDHAKNLPMQRMTDEKMLAQRQAVRELAAGRMELLHGTELNIGPDGEVDWNHDFLAGFDLCVAGVHSHFQQSPAEMTRRLVRACEHPYVHIISHPCTRQIGRREPVDFDADEVFAAAVRTGTALEINSFPDRLDLPDELVLRAKRRGVKFAVDTDSHATVHLLLKRAPLLSPKPDAGRPPQESAPSGAPSSGAELDRGRPPQSGARLTRKVVGVRVEVCGR